MKPLIMILSAIALLLPFTSKADYQPFQIKIKPGTNPVSIRVFAKDNRKKYSIASLIDNTWDVDVRGQLHHTEYTSGYRIKQARIRYGKDNESQQNYDISAVASVEESHLTILEQATRFSGVCKVTLSGVIKTNLPNTNVKFQYERTNGNRSNVKSVTTSHTRIAMFSHTYTVVYNPYDDEARSIRIVGVNHNFQSAWKTYTMRCEDAATTKLQTETPPQLTLQETVLKTRLIKGQICPKDLLIRGRVSEGSSISGHAVFIGSGTTSYQSEEMPFSMHIGDDKVKRKPAKKVLRPWEKGDPVYPTQANKPPSQMESSQTRYDSDIVALNSRATMSGFRSQQIAGLQQNEII